MILKKYAVLILICAAIVIKSATAATLPSQEDKLVWDFTNIAFSDVLWNANSSEPAYAVSSLRQGFVSQNDSVDSWLRAYTQRDVLPKAGTLAKWNLPIKIAIGWPQYKTGFLNQEADSSKDLLIENVVRNLAPDISKLTGLSASFVAKSNESDARENFAKLRIVPVRGSLLDNYFKAGDHYPSSVSYEEPSHQITQSFVGAVAFTPFSRTQVDGFILPDAQGDIGFSACRVNVNLPDNLLKKLIAECLVRSLGLPLLAQGNNQSLLSAWNKANDGISKIPSAEGDAAFYGMRRAGDVGKVKDVADGEIGIDGYAQKMIKMLYCTDIQSGMDKLAAVKALTAGCLKN